jgi:enoyl-[acyl-carrier protein] reductase II
MIRTPVCDLLQIEHPIALGGMGSVYGPALTAAVSNAGGLGAMGCHYMNAEQIRISTGLIREQTNKALWPSRQEMAAISSICPDGRLERAALT